VFLELEHENESPVLKIIQTYLTTVQMVFLKRMRLMLDFAEKKKWMEELEREYQELKRKHQAAKNRKEEVLNSKIEKLEERNRKLKSKIDALSKSDEED